MNYILIHSTKIDVSEVLPITYDFETKKYNDVVIKTLSEIDLNRFSNLKELYVRKDGNLIKVVIDEIGVDNNTITIKPKYSELIESVEV